MRRTGTLAMALMGVVLPLAQAMAAGCTTPQEDKAFLLLSLRTELMETALTCNAQEQYNTFMTRFQPDMAAQEKVVNQFFRTRGGQHAHDVYVTQLANSESDGGLVAGTLLCTRNLPMFDAIAWVHNSDELQAYANGQYVTVPDGITDCTDTETLAPARHAAAHRRRR